MFALVGYWMQSIAQSWLLYKMTESATLLGLLGFAGSLPILLLSPFAGIWSDRCNLHRVMFVTQALEMAQAITLATLALTGNLQPWHIIALSMVMGVLIAVEIPVRHAYLLELVGDKSDLPNAIAVTSLMANCGRLVGPALAGLVIGWLGGTAGRPRVGRTGDRLARRIRVLRDQRSELQRGDHQLHVHPRHPHRTRCRTQSHVARHARRAVVCLALAADPLAAAAAYHAGPARHTLHQPDASAGT